MINQALKWVCFVSMFAISCVHTETGYLKNVKFRIVEETTGEPLKNRELNICYFVHIRLRPGALSPYLNKDADFYITSVTTDGNGQFTLDLSSIDIADIVVEPGKLYNIVRFERSSDLAHTKSVDHIRVVRFKPGTTRVVSNMIYDIKRKTVKTIPISGEAQEKPYGEILLVAKMLKQSPSKPAIQIEGEVEKNLKPYISFKHKDRVDKVLFTPDGSRILSESFKDDLKISETLTGKLLRTLPFNGYSANSMALSSDGVFLAVGTNTGKVKLWDIKSMRLQKTFPVTEWSIYAVALSPDGKMLGSCAADGTIQLWDIESSRLLYSLGKKGGRMISMSFSGDSKFIAALSRTGRISVWDVANGQLVGALHIKRISEIGSIAFCPDRNSVAIAAPDGIRFWNPQNDGQIRMVELPNSINPEKIINGLGPDSRPIYMGMTIISQDCKTAATVIEDGSIVVWDIKTRAIQQKLAGLRIPDSAGGGIRAITFSPDKRLLASGNRNGTVEIYRLVEGIVVKEPYGHVGGE